MEDSKIIKEWRYEMFSNKYDYDIWGIMVFNSEDEPIAQIMHKSFEDFKDDEDLADYAFNLVEAKFCM